MVIDVNAYTGHWPTQPVEGDVESVMASLKAAGVDLVCLSPLGAAWGTNPHQYNEEVYEAARSFEEARPVPVLDPTIATWRQELKRAADHPKVRMIRLLPAYSPYELADAEDLLCEAEESDLVVAIQTRLDDPRRQHALAQVPDIPAGAIADVAEQRPDLTVIIGGARMGEIRGLGARLLGLPNLYADTSQADGLDGMKVLIGEGLVGKLLFGSHAPLFIAWSAMARVVTDISEEDAAAILGGNAEAVLGLG